MNRIAAVATAALMVAAAWLPASQDANIEVEQLSDNVYLYTYNVHRSLFVVTDDGVLATDPQSPQAGRRFVEEIRKITDAPIRYLVYSHHHDDHVSGGAAFPDGTTVISHRNAVTHIEAGSEIRAVDEVFDDERSIRLGDLEVRLLYPGPSETDSSIIVWIPDQGVAFMVDAVAVRTVPWQRMTDASPYSWIEALERLDALDFEILAPGHGPTGRKEDVGENIQYLRDLTAAVQEWIDRGESLEQIQANLELPQYAGWTRYDQHFDLNIEGVYRELTKEGDGVNWPGFRGTRASGIAEGYPTPTTWDAEAGDNMLWKTPLPGLGHSSPVVWGDRVFVTTAVSSADNSLRVGLYGDIAPVEDDSQHTWIVYAIDKISGEIVWERTAHAGIPKIKRHTKGTHANATMATDGEHIVAYFGSEGLYVYDMEGNEVWRKDLGVLDAGFYVVPEAQWGVASSPIIHDGRVIIQADVQDDSFVAAFDIADGTEIWRTPRNDVPTFGTPNVYESSWGQQLVVNGYHHIGAYDPGSGEELWRLRGGGDIPVPTPIFGHDLIFITNAHGSMSPIYAIRASAAGDISLAEDATSNDHVAWSVRRGGGYMVTPLVYGDYLYNLRNNGALSVFDARTGERMYQERLGNGGGFSASPVAANSMVYFTSEDGDIFVVKAGPELELLATNNMGEVCMATPAISEGMLLFRTQGHIMAIAPPQ